MDVFSTIILLSVIQGITEFLPISSSAHLVIIPSFLTIEPPALWFIIVLHTATLLALVTYFAKDLFRFSVALVSRRDTQSRQELVLLLLATIPGALMGFLFYSTIAGITSTTILALFLLFTSMLFLIAERYTSSKNMTAWGETLSTSRASIIGISQAFALFPGVSRSGITIATGCLVGLSRKEATRFSFLLAIPTIFGALVVSLVMIPDTTIVFDSLFVILGFPLTYLIALSVIHLFLTFVERVGLLPFALYQIILAGVLLLLVL